MNVGTAAIMLLKRHTKKAESPELAHRDMSAAHQT
jgi:hypothetical protein